MLRDAAGSARMAFQQVAVLPEATWPEGPVPADAPGSDGADDSGTRRQHEWALTPRRRLLHDRSDDPEEPLRVYADPAGHSDLHGRILCELGVHCGRASGRPRLRR